MLKCLLFIDALFEYWIFKVSTGILNILERKIYLHFLDYNTALKFTGSVCSSADFADFN